ncbi:MAG: DUF2752 domain-containing protein [Chitinophagaceae bacterium]
MYFFFDARNSNIFPQCIFHSLTGLYCPGCGSQRAFSALLHGDVISAIQNNILMVASLPFIIYSAIIFVLNTFRKKQIIQKIFYSVVFVRLVFIVVILFAVVRNIPIYPFNLLAPH